MINKNTSFWVLSISLVVLLICPILIQDGMFMDGQQYAIVAKNLAEGKGTFWFPHLSDTWMKAGSQSFMEHPPLVYGIQSLFFSVFGDSLYVERFYSFLSALITAFLIVLCWRLIFKDDVEFRKLSWFPVLLWIIIPVDFWAFQNNMQENTMGIFTLLSVYFSLMALLIERRVYFHLLLAGIALFLATLSKGPPGLFPLLAIAIYYFSKRTISLKKMLGFSLILLLIPLLLYSFLLLNDSANESLSFYFNERLIQRIQHEGVVENRFYSIGKVFLELIPSLLLTSLILLFARSKAIAYQLNSSIKKFSLFFFLIGISASFPLILTSVQRGFYLVPSMPFFAIALAIVAAPSLFYLVNKMGSKAEKILAFVSILLLISSLTISLLQIGKIGRDKEMLQDIYLIGEEVPKGSSIKIEAYQLENWSLQFYFLRYFSISMSDKIDRAVYFLVEKEHQPIEGFQKIPLATQRYDLYKRN